MDIKDYIHLYYKCPCLFRFGPTGAWKVGKVKEIALQRIHTLETYEVKLFLRPPSSMNADENFKTLCLNNYYATIFEGIDDRRITYRLHYNNRRSKVYGTFLPVQAKTPAAFHYQLSLHLDLFGLIEAGLAIDNTKADCNG